MFSALAYLQWHTLKNRLWQRVRRLRNPRYLFGALIGIGYFVMLFRRSFSHMNIAGPGLLPGVTDAIWEFLAAFALFVLAALAWLVPHERAALVFSEAEIAFLFPAPVRRQTLIHYKLVRSQIAVLFTVGFLTLLTRWSGGVGGALMRAAGLWLLLTTINLHLLGSSFARTMLLDRGITSWQRRTALAGLLGVLVVGAYLWVHGGNALNAARGDLPTTDGQTLQSYGDYLRYIGELSRSPAAVYLLAPFRWVVRPFLASGDPHVFGLAVGPALGVLAAHYLWVTQSDVAFEEASLEASRRQVARVAAARAGRGLNARPHKRRRAPFRLAPTGPPAVAILWKNLLSAGQLFSARFAVTLLGWSAFVGFTFRGGGHGEAVWPQLVGTMSLVLAVWSVVLGPQVVRQDFRQDLAVADLLKVYPLRGWQLALGELLTPALVLTLLQWVLIVLAASLWKTEVSEDGSPLWQSHLSLAAAAMILTLPLNVVSLVVPNAAALLLPAWFANPATPGAARGVEVVGQRFIFLLGQFVVLLLAALPVALTLFLVYILAAEPLLGTPWALPVAALAAALVCAAEAAGGLLLLGHWFENYDMSAEKPA